MFKRVGFLGRREQGVTATEYALIIVVVAIAMLAGASLLGSDLSSMFSSVGGSI